MNKIYKQTKEHNPMTTEMVTIPKEEYEKLKKSARVDWELVDDFKQGLKELKEGKAIKC